MNAGVENPCFLRLFSVCDVSFARPARKSPLLSIHSASALHAGSAPEPKPNVVYIMADDMGYADPGFNGGKEIQTPNLNRLAKSGAVPSSFHVQPVCSPARASLMRGRYVAHTGVYSVIRPRAARGLPLAECTLAPALGGAGCQTAISGKWRQVGETPRDWGFDEYRTDPTAGGWFWQKSYENNGEQIKTPEKQYNPDILQQFGIDFIGRHKDKPFLLYYPVQLVHGPILRTPDSKPGTKDCHADNIAYMDKKGGGRGARKTNRPSHEASRHHRALIAADHPELVTTLRAKLDAHWKPVVGKP